MLLKVSLMSKEGVSGRAPVFDRRNLGKGGFVPAKWSNMTTGIVSVLPPGGTYLGVPTSRTYLARV